MRYFVRIEKIESQWELQFIEVFTDIVTTLRVDDDCLSSMLIGILQNLSEQGDYDASRFFDHLYLQERRKKMIDLADSNN